MFRWHWILIFTAIAIASASPSFAENARQLTHPPLNNFDWWPNFSPRGDKVAFSRYPDGGSPYPAIFTVDVATGAEDTLVSGLPLNWTPNGGLDWSPDGRKVAFYAPQGTDPHAAIWVADVPGPVVPRIVASCPNSNGTGRYCLDSNGTIYFFGNVSPRCPDGGIEISIQGNMFDGGAPPSPVISLDVAGSPLVAVLQNGDVWQACGPGSWIGRFAGNIFNAAGITAVQQPRTPLGVSRLAPNRPNPFNPATKIPYTLAIPGRVTIRVFDAVGRLVRTIEDVEKPRGSYTATWGGETDHGTRAGSGTFFLKITYPDGTSAEQKLTVLK